MAFDRTTGEVVWEQVARDEVPHEGYQQPNGSYAAGSAVTDGEYLFAFFGSWGLYAYDLDGRLQWEVDLGTRSMRNGFGEGTTPTLHGETLVVTWDHIGGQSFIVALDKRTGEERWPARLPMTKAVVRAMDTVTDFLSKPEGGEVVVDKFVAAGGSKRGWTTWSIAAVDKRIVAIVPIVIDMLNVIPSFKHHYRAYGFYAPAVGDYVEMGIMGWQDTPEYKRLLEIIEPYEYLERYTMPKFLINACGDQFFLPDSWKFYYKNLLGQKHIRYVPNAGHSLDGSDAVYSLAAYYNAILNKTKLPEYDWNVQEDGSIRVTTKVRPKEVLLWQCTNTETRDFRIETTGKTWKSSKLKPVSRGTYVGKVSEPAKGWTAFMVELTYAEPIKRGISTKRGGRLGQATGRVGAPFKFTTGVNVLPETMPFEFKDMPIPNR